MNPQPERIENLKPAFEVVCSWCGAVIRSSTIENSEQMCLICHARMLNDYFQRLRQLGDEKRRR
jgi:acetyl-CoA carboxylase beta subunit